MVLLLLRSPANPQLPSAFPDSLDCVACSLIAPVGCRLADTLRAMEADSAEKARGLATYGRATQLLGDSTQLLHEAQANLQRTQVSSWGAAGGAGAVGAGASWVPCTCLEPEPGSP